MSETETHQQKQRPTTSDLAFTSLILGVLSFCTLCLTAIPAIICGIISLVKISKSRGQLKGQGLAIAGIAIPVVSLPIILVFVLVPELERAKQNTEQRMQMMCASNLKQLGGVMMMYADDGPEGVYPTASRWCDLLDPYIGQYKEVLKCNAVAQGPCNYAINKNIQKLGVSAPGDMVLLFETKGGWNQFGGPELLTTENHEGRGCNVVFNNYDVKFVKTGDLHKLKWEDEQSQ